MNYDLGVVIPVRLGSSRVSQKALLPVGEDSLTLLAWKIRQVKAVVPKANIYVSTEADELKAIASEEGVQIHHRDYYLADAHKASFSEVITGVVADIPHQHIAWVTCVVPLMGPSEYEQGFREYEAHVINGKFDSLVSVNSLKEYFWGNKEPLNYQADKNHTISQDLEALYKVTNGLYMSSKEQILECQYLLGPEPFKSSVSKIAGIDIDVYEDYEMAKGLVGFYHKQEAKAQQSQLVFLDFDGVLFDSAAEAYAIAMLTSQKAKTLSEVDLESDHAKRFLAKRYLIGPAWNYYFLLAAIDKGIDDDFISFLPDEPGDEGRDFQSAFFATRQVIRNNFWQEWLGFNLLYSGLDKLLQLIETQERIVILSTKDKVTIQALLEVAGIKRDVLIFDSKTYSEFGCKSNFIDAYMKEQGVKRALFIDDSAKYIDKAGWVENLTCLQACWGYVSPENYADNKQEVIDSIIKILA